MPGIGIHEIEKRASEIIRNVREEQAEYVVVYRGKPVATISPIRDDADGQSIDNIRPDVEFWARFDALAAAIDANWTSNMTAVEVVDEQCRDLATMFAGGTRRE